MPSNVFNNSNNQNYGKSSPDVQHPMVQQQKSIESPKIYQQAQPQRSPSPRNYPTARSTSPRPYQSPQQQQSSSPRTEFRSVAPPQSPNVNVYTTPNANTEQRSVESPFKFASQVPQQQAPQPQQQSTAQTVPWRTQRNQQTNNNMPAQQQQQQQTQQFTPSMEQETKPTNVGSLYIAPLQAPVEPQAQHIIRQMQQQQQQPRNSPIRQVPVQQQQQQPQPQQQSQLRQAAPWMKSQPPPREQPEWVRADEPGNIVPSSLNRLKSPPPVAQQQQQRPSVEVRYQTQAQPQAQPQRQHQPQVQFYPQQNKQFDTPELQQQQYRYNEPHSVQGNGFNTANPAPTSGVTGLRLQINTTSSGASNSGKEHIIPIQLEQTPTYSPQQPNFNVQATSGNKCK